MQKILKIAQREYIETVKTKTFLLGILMTPAIIAMVVFINSRVRRSITGPRPPRKVVVADLSKELTAEIKASFDEYNARNPQRQILLQELQTDESSAEVVKNKVRNGHLDAYVVLDKDSIEGTGKIRSFTRGTKIADLDLVSTVENRLNDAVINQRCKLWNVSPELLAELRRRVPAERVDIGSASQEKRIKGGEQVAKTMVPFFFMFLMFMGIFGMGQHMLTSVIEEKNSRVIEVLLSAVSPFELMVGKIIGLAGISLTVIGLWAIAAGGTAYYGAAHWWDINIDVPTEILPYFVIYFVLGFLLFSSVLAGIGSICNTIKEAQSLMMPISLMFILPMIAWFNLAQDPNGPLARVLSFLPPLTPIVMTLRLASSRYPSVLEVLASIILLAMFVLAVMWAAAKVFRTGILMYGKRPGLWEVLQWLKQS
ncbi:MAG: ABC transporter permease [Sedimentisphaerales bacterium]